MRRTVTPDFTGWYWCQSDNTGQWHMAMVDAESEITDFYSDFETPFRCANSLIGEAFGACEWHGPLVCPGGPFGGSSALAGEDEHADAAKSGKAIVIKHADFTHCPGTRGGTITVVGLCSAEEASRRVADMASPQ